MKVAIVHDWLTEMGGAEKVLKELYNLYPNADIFTLVKNDEVLKKMDIPTHKVSNSFIQNLPFAKTKYRNYLPFFPLAIETFDLSSYDVIISSSYCVAKGVLTHAQQKHFCYCHSPVRYAWDLHHQYLKESNLEKGFKGFLAKYFLHKLRIWDITSLNRVDYFISNSNYIKKRIKKVYNREATTIYPPVDISSFSLKEKKEEYYFTCSRLVPYKKIDLIVETFSKLKDKKLVVIGTGPDYDKIKKLAGSNVEMLGYQNFDILKKYMENAKAFVFAAEEDFGIVPLEAQATGTPVIAFGKGGALETVVDEETGIFFEEQTVESLTDAIYRFENKKGFFIPSKIRTHAENFSTENFTKNISSFIKEHLANS